MSDSEKRSRTASVQHHAVSLVKGTVHHLGAAILATVLRAALVAALSVAGIAVWHGAESGETTNAAHEAMPAHAALTLLDELT